MSVLPPPFPPCYRLGQPLSAPSLPLRSRLPSLPPQMIDDGELTCQSDTPLSPPASIPLR
jgi:hypothetical protein